MDNDDFKDLWEIEQSGKQTSSRCLLAADEDPICGGFSLLEAIIYNPPTFHIQDDSLNIL